MKTHSSFTPIAPGIGMQCHYHSTLSPVQVSVIGKSELAMMHILKAEQ